MGYKRSAVCLVVQERHISVSREGSEAWGKRHLEAGMRSMRSGGRIFGPLMRSHAWLHGSLGPVTLSRPDFSLQVLRNLVQSARGSLSQTDKMSMMRSQK